MRLISQLLIIVAIMVFGALPAWADHMNGSYSGTGQIAGTNLELRQSGRSVTGQLTGATQATLNGQSDGGDNVSGTVNIAGVGQLQFQGRWSAEGFMLRLTGPGGNEEHFFASGGGGSGPGTPTTQTPDWPTTPTTQNPGWPTTQTPPPVSPPPPPPPPDLPIDYYLLEAGQQIGPLTRVQVLERLASGASQGSDLVWKTGLDDWTRIDSLDELNPARGGPPPPPPEQSTPSGSSEQEEKLSSILFGATFGILAHELGHALIGEFQIPSTGPEEDTADEFAAIIMSLFTTGDEFAQHPPGTQRVLLDMVQYSSLLWFHDAQKNAQAGQGIPWYDEHSSSETRFRNTLCMIYGSSPALYSDLAERVGFPPRQRERCEIDYAKRYAAWETITTPIAREGDGTTSGGQPAETTGAKVEVVYQESQTAFGSNIKPLIEQTGVITEFVKMLGQVLVWERDFQVVFADCGTPNAFYDPSQAHIVMCWEGLEHFFWIIAEPEGFQRQTTPGLAVPRSFAWP